MSGDVQARCPQEPTLRKYGLTEGEWRDILERQDGACAVCRQVPKSGRLCIDHEHVPAWKHKPPEERKRFVRGLLCYRCNTTYVGRSITIERSRNVTDYLVAYHRRLYGLPEGLL